MSADRGRRQRAWIGIAAIVVLAAVVGVVAWRASLSPLRADPADPVLVAEGREVYGKSCASCHGARLEGQPDWRARMANGRLPAPPHDADGHTWHHPDRQLFQITKYGLAAIVPGYESDMPVYGGILSDRQIWAVLAFIKSTWPEEIRDRQERANRADAGR